MPIDVKQYDSAIPWISEDARFSKLVGNLSNNDDRLRLKAYELYEDMYNNRTEHIKITVRSGDDEDDDCVEIYMPSAKKCIEAINRFLAVNFEIIPDPTIEAQASAATVAAMLDTIAKRNRLKSKIAQFKRYGLMKGDAILHVYANPFRPPGKRICVEELKPEHYFPIENIVTGETVGCYIVDIINNPRNSIPTKLHSNNTVVRRQTYMKLYDAMGNPTGVVTSELGLYEIGRWDERVLPEDDINLIQIIKEPYPLPQPINQLPIYHWGNNRPPSSSFGMSELAGVESIINAINQSMSDEDLTLIMQGLGVYWTDASPPLNAAGEEVEWEISPRSVVQVASGGQFGRVTGVASLQPFGDHINALDEAMQQALGVPDISIGQVDVATAESGISLMLKLGPLLAKNAEKEIDLHDVLDQFIYDIVQGWIPAYEEIPTDGIIFISQFDDPMPRNKSKDLSDLLSIWTTALNAMPIAWFYEQLNTIMGYHLDPAGDFEAALQDAMRLADAAQGTPMEPQQGVDANGNPLPAGAPATNGQGA